MFSGKRLKEIRLNKSLTLLEFSKILNIPDRTLGSYEREERKVSAELLEVLITQLKLSPDWLFTGEGEMYSSKTGDDFIKIPILGEVECTISPNCYLDNKKPESHISIPEALLNQTNANIKTSHILKVKGDSMEPNILDGDKVLADSSKKQILNNKIYIIRIEDILTIKRLQKLPKGVIKVTSDNKEYDSYTLKPDEDNYEVYAQVLWLSRYVY